MLSNSIAYRVQTTRCTMMRVSLIWFRYQLTMFGIRVSIGLSRILPTHIAYEIDNAKIIAAFFRISYCLHDLNRLNSIVGHVQTTRCTMMLFSWSIPLQLTMFYVWNSSIDRAILTPSCTYFVWNRYFQNYRRILPNFLLFAWFDTVEFYRLPWSNNKMYDDEVFDDRFRY